MHVLHTLVFVCAYVSVCMCLKVYLIALVDHRYNKCSFHSSMKSVIGSIVTSGAKSQLSVHREFAVSIEILWLTIQKRRLPRIGF